MGFTTFRHLLGDVLGMRLPEVINLAARKMTIYSLIVLPNFHWTRMFDWPFIVDLANWKWDVLIITMLRVINQEKFLPQISSFHPAAAGAPTQNSTKQVQNTFIEVMNMMNIDSTKYWECWRSSRGDENHMNMMKAMCSEYHNADNNLISSCCIHHWGSFAPLHLASLALR